MLGDVTLGAHASVWYGAVLRGDMAAILVGEKPERAAYAAAAKAALHGAKPQKFNAFKITLAKRAIVRALSSLAVSV